jgi:hypothetical protein
MSLAIVCERLQRASRCHDRRGLTRHITVFSRELERVNA